MFVKKIYIKFNAIKEYIMHAHIKSVLIEGFAKHLKIRDIQSNDGDAFALTLLAKKYLALGVNVVPTQRVYDAISSDYALLSMRTHYPPLAAYSEPTNAPIDPVTFAEIVKQGFGPSGKKHAHLIESSIEFNRFVDLITQRAPDQESWVDVCRKDKWKDVALFLGLNYKENPCFYKILKAVSEKDDVSELNKHMLAYKPRNMQALEKEMVAFIQSIDLPVEFCDQIFSASIASDSPLVSATKGIEPRQVEEKGGKKSVILSHLEPQNNLEDLRERMEPYRRRAGLPVVVDTKRIAQQLVYAALGEDIPANLLTKSQRALIPIAGEEEETLVMDIIQSEALDEETLKKIIASSQKANKVIDAANRREWDTRVLLQHAIQPARFLDERTLARFNKL